MQSLRGEFVEGALRSCVKAEVVALDGRNLDAADEGHWNEFARQAPGELGLEALPVGRLDEQRGGQNEQAVAQGDCSQKATREHGEGVLRVSAVTT